MHCENFVRGRRAPRQGYGTSGNYVPNPGEEPRPGGKLPMNGGGWEPPERSRADPFHLTQPVPVRRSIPQQARAYCAATTTSEVTSASVACGLVVAQEAVVPLTVHEYQVVEAFESLMEIEPEEDGPQRERHRVQLHRVGGVQHVVHARNVVAGDRTLAHTSASLSDSVPRC